MIKLSYGMSPEDIRSYPRSDEDEEKSKQVWLKGHTGMSSIIDSNSYGAWLYFVCRLR